MQKIPVRLSIEIYKREIWGILDTFEDELEKRVYLYELLQQYNDRLLESAVKCGVNSHRLDHFIDEGVKGLYGLDRHELRKYKNLPEDSNIYDYMGVNELFINLVFLALSEENLISQIESPHHNT